MKLRSGLAVLAGGALLAWLAIAMVGRASAKASAATARAAMLEQNAAVVAAAFKAARDSIPVLRAQVAAVQVRAQHERQRLLAQVGAATEAADAARATLVDTSADVPTLRHTVTVLLAANDSLVRAAAAHLAITDSLERAHARERAFLYRGMALADSALAAERKVSAAWKQAATCRVLWFDCPTRTQVALGAVAVTLVAVKAAK